MADSPRDAPAQPAEPTRSALWLAALAFVPALGAVWMVLRMGAPVPVSDDWEMMRLLLRAREQGLGLADLFAQHNEARVPLPRLLFLALSWNGWDSRSFMLLSVGLTAVASWCLGLVAGQTLGRQPAARWGLLLAANVLLFSLAQFETWLWGFMLLQVLPMAILAVALWLAVQSWSLPLKAALLALLCVAAMFSLANGLLCWGVLFALLWAWHGRELGQRKGLIVAWWLAAAVCVAVYFLHYVSPAGHPSPLRGLQNPLGALSYLLIFTGSPLVRAVRNATLLPMSAWVMGLLLVGATGAATAHWLRQRHDVAFRRAAAPWLALAWFVILSAALAASSRVGFGVTHALQYRYITAAVYLAVAVLYLVPLTLQHVCAREAWQAGRRWSASWALGLAMGAAGLGVLGSINMLDFALVKSRLLRSATAALQFSPLLPLDDVLGQRLYPAPEALRQWAMAASSQGLLTPPLHGDPLLAALVGEPARTAAGVPELRQSTEQGWVAAGTALLPHRQRGADAIVVTWATSDQQPRLLRLVLEIEFNHVPSGMMNQWCQWSVRVPRTALPAEAQWLQFWAYDADEGSIHALPEAIRLTSP